LNGSTGSINPARALREAVGLAWQYAGISLRLMGER